MCYTPITLKKNYKAMSDSDQREKFNGGLAHTVPCGKCPDCLRRRQAGWVFRLREEMKVSTSAVFLTLTYEDISLPLSTNGIPTLEKSDYQKFMKRLRKKVGNSVKLKYYSCGEYGTRGGRPHYHAIMFNLPKSFVSDPQLLTEIWSHGIVSVDSCTIASITYVTKYMMKGKFSGTHELDDREPEFSMMSKKLGISHLTPQMIRYYRENFQSYVTLNGGVKTAMPRYFREKVFNKDERAELNVTARESADKVFEQQFNNDYGNEFQWKKDQFRKNDRKNREERLKF